MKRAAKAVEELTGYDQQRGRPPIALATPVSDPTPIDWGGRVEMFKRTNVWPLPWGLSPAQADAGPPLTCSLGTVSARLTCVM
jgi:hypothetical protein